MSNGTHEKVAIVPATGAAYAINLDDGSCQVITLTASCAFTFTRPPPSGKLYSFMVVAIQGGAGSFGISWPASVVWQGGTPPSLTTTVGKKDIFSFMSYDGGVTWIGAIIGKGY